MNNTFDLSHAIKNFFSREEKSGVLLLLFAMLALIIVNSPLQSLYFEIKYTYIPINIGDFSFTKNVSHWVNDGLMAIFFFVIGLELKREILEGELSSFDRMVLPAIAAIGGMLAPAVVYVLINYSNPENMSGWAIPTATDIAFSLAVLILLGKSVPLSLKVFLLSLAIIDDLGAVLIIAFFYTSEISMIYLSYSAAVLALLILLNLSGSQKMYIYILLGIFLWYFVLKSGVHATIAGVLLATTIPNNHKNSIDDSMLKQLEHKLHNFVGILVLPMFAFFNSDINFSDVTLDSLYSPLSLGIVLGLLLGKPIGITFFTYIGMKTKLFKLPDDVTLKDIFGLSFLCGIGFTMSLFINGLAFSDPVLVDSSKLGIFIGSIVSAVAGYLILKSRYQTNS
ncbi:MAG: Na+/H+ antiporter NhaA [Gammaproteobacteria bacterium]|nr:Na+/H+ antiporter NhaA [Gammaproteobacteria bacterium]MBL6818862.1 Na+/H+ antiporter NhaA [Gammaproteobacteria bacterium]MBL6898636.1 Na+/H+ antiporter NhaA [Gammaproteobacteria bacterium]